MYEFTVTILLLMHHLLQTMHCLSRVSLRPVLSLSRSFHLSAMAPVAVGDKLPSVALFENSPGNKVDIAELCAGKKVTTLLLRFDIT